MKAGFGAAATAYRLKPPPGFPSQWMARRDKAAINIDVIFRHALDRKTALEGRANLGAVQLGDAANRGDGLLNIVND